jgi:hypothetical protein
MAPELNTSVQLVPLALFAVLVFFRVLRSESPVDAMSSLFELDGLLDVLFLSFLVIAPSFASGSEMSFEFALLISACLILARLYMAVVPVREVLEAFFWSGILSVAIFIPSSLAGLFGSMETLERFSPFNFHPNLLAFVLAGYFCVMIWKFLSGSWSMKTLSGVVGLICLIVIFFASSRGSIVGILGGCSFVAGMTVLRTGKGARKKVLQFGLMAAVVLLALFFFVQNLEWAQNTYAFADRFLELTDNYRGIGTGFTGRFDKWASTIRVLSDGSWLVGHGLRTSDSMEDQLIDNSYLVILFELGLMPVVLITIRFLDISRRFLKVCFLAVSRDERHFYLVCSLLMVAFLLNNIVARYLFGVGNPFSLLAFLLFATPTRRIVPPLALSTCSRGSHAAS